MIARFIKPLDEMFLFMNELEVEKQDSIEQIEKAKCGLLFFPTAQGCPFLFEWGSLI